MRGYSIGEDNIVLEAALIVGVHRRRGKLGGINKLASKTFKTYQTLCHSRGLATTRNVGSLKMRMYRLFRSGIMKWGSHHDKSCVLIEHRSPLRNIGTSDQRATREYLMKMMFDLPCNTLSHIPVCETKRRRAALHSVSHQARPADQAARAETISREAREAVEAARAARRARRAAARENESSSGPCHAIANPEESRCLSAVRTEIYRPRNVLPHRTVEGNYKFSAQQAYKENLRAVRELAAMRHETLQCMRREYESYNDFLKECLSELAEQQKNILQMMGTEAASKW